MSSVVRNKGTLYPTNRHPDTYKKNEIEDSETLFLIHGKVYEVVYEVEREDFDDCFCELYKFPDGSVYFHTIHHCSGGHWTEIVEQHL